MAVNWLAVVVGTIWYQALGAAWYGPLFGSTWMEAMGFAGPEDVPADGMTSGYVMTTLGSLVAAATLALVVGWAGATTITQGLGVGALVAVGFVATSALQAVPFEGRSWPVYALNAGYNVVALAGIGALLAVW